MLKRTRNALLAATTVAALGVTAPAALAQQYPVTSTTTSTSTTSTTGASTTSTTGASTTSTTAGATTSTAAVSVCTNPPTSSGALTDGASVNLSLTCVPLVDGASVTGVLNSTPIALPVVRVNGDTATFPVTIPRDFEQGAYHTLTVTEAGSGRLLANSRFFVDRNGNIKTAPSGGDLPRTGSNSTSGLAKAGAGLVALGAAGVVVAAKRRRDAANVTA